MGRTSDLAGAKGPIMYPPYRRSCTRSMSIAEVAEVLAWWYQVRSRMCATGVDVTWRRLAIRLADAALGASDVSDASLPARWKATGRLHAVTRWSLPRANRGVTYMHAPARLDLRRSGGAMNSCCFAIGNALAASCCTKGTAVASLLRDDCVTRLLAVGQVSYYATPRGLRLALGQLLR